MSTAVAVVLFVAVTAYAVFGGADFGAGFWDLVAGGAERGERPREVIDHSIGPVWEANHVWLIFCFVVLWTGFPEAYASITLTLFVPLTLAAFGIVLRGSSFAFRKAVFRTRDRRNFGAAFAVSSVLVPVLHGRGRRRHRLRAGARRRRGRRPVDELGQPDVGPRRRAGRRRRRLPRRRLPGVGRPPARRSRRWSSTSGAGPSAPRSSPASSRSSASSCCAPTPRYLFDGLTSRALPLVHRRPRSCGIGSLVLLRARRRPGRPAARHRRGRQRRGRLGRGAVALHPARDPRGGRRRGARRARSPPSSSPRSAPCVIVLPASSCCTSSTSGACCPTRASTDGRPASCSSCAPTSRPERVESVGPRLAAAGGVRHVLVGGRPAATWCRSRASWTSASPTTCSHCCGRDVPADDVVLVADDQHRALGWRRRRREPRARLSGVGRDHRSGRRARPDGAPVRAVHGGRRRRGRRRRARRVVDPRGRGDGAEPGPAADLGGRRRARRAAMGPGRPGRRSR